uniref:Zinc finger, CCHC-type n=1 Tax=Tanacetum cinerariifolium TaxID=118510 RepID=A0A699J5C3_TANCI|nr:zinc finger, CCHC-type [Tanacetum cinerariifolium]
MAEEDALLVDDDKDGLCVDYTDAGIVKRCHSGTIRIRAKWENDDYVCRGHVLNGMTDSLFDVYMNVESAKELWDSLEFKYMAEDASKESLRVQESDKGKGKEVGGLFVNMTEEDVEDARGMGHFGTFSEKELNNLEENGLKPNCVEVVKKDK